MQGEPRSCLHRWRAALADDEIALLLVDFELRQYWLEGSGAKPLTALYHCSGGRLRVAVTDRRLSATASSPTEQFDNWVAHHQLLSVVAGAPLELLPREIPKPWGREVWYTAVEARGVCNVGAGNAHPGVDRSAPIPWLQAVLPDGSAGPVGQPLILLKILDPAPQPVSGDLYFELHEVKREVYVVTHVDEVAWPDGVGYVRCGFDPEQVRSSASDQEFRGRYLAAVEAYEEVRRAVDEWPAAAEEPVTLLAQEQKLREHMDGFTHMRPLRKGDVVVVPPLLPHALQHGVRTVEFQTPVYERKILSFAQKVLTQEHWDTRSAVSRMLLEPPPVTAFACLVEGDGVLVERIVDFPDFEVRRVRLEAGSSVLLEPVQDYCVALVIAGEFATGMGRYGAEQALLLPRGWQDRLTPAKPAQSLVLLLAFPRC